MQMYICVLFNWDYCEQGGFCQSYMYIITVHCDMFSSADNSGHKFQSFKRNSTLKMRCTQTDVSRQSAACLFKVCPISLTSGLAGEHSAIPVAAGFPLDQAGQSPGDFPLGQRPVQKAPLSPCTDNKINGCLQNFLWRHCDRINEESCQYHYLLDSQSRNPVNTTIYQTHRI